jgi:hypothetical protein
VKADQFAADDHLDYHQLSRLTVRTLHGETLLGYQFAARSRDTIPCPGCDAAGTSIGKSAPDLSQSPKTWAPKRRTAQRGPPATGASEDRTEPTASVCTWPLTLVFGTRPLGVGGALAAGGTSTRGLPGAGPGFVVAGTAGRGGLGARDGASRAISRRRDRRGRAALRRAEPRCPTVHAEPSPRHPQVVGVALAQWPNMGGHPAVLGPGVASIVVQPRTARVVIVSEPGGRLAVTSRAGAVCRVHGVETTAARAPNRAPGTPVGDMRTARPRIEVL